MSKDTKNLGHDKALAWESRGFVSSEYNKRSCLLLLTRPLLKTAATYCILAGAKSPTAWESSYPPITRKAPNIL